MSLTDSHIALLRALQEDASLTIEQLAEKTAVSHTTLWRRLKELEEREIITGRVTKVDPQKAGFSVCAFVYVNIVSHNNKNRSAFEKLVDTTPEILECFSITGPNDYIIKIRVRDIAAYENLLMDKILAHPSVASASSNITLREHKSTTALPL